MPYTGFDPREPGDPIDPSGGGLDPSAYYGQSPGGRFPGDVQNYLDYLYALSTGTAGGNPDYDIPDWLQRILPGRLGQAANFHERNVREGGVGQSPDLPAGFPHQLYSGPAARFGPPGGDLHGLLDIGREHGFFDGPDIPGGGSGAQGPGKKKGGGGGGGGNFTFTPPAQSTYTPSFVDWQPIQPFTAGGGETRLTGPARTIAPGKVPEPPKPGKQPKLPKQPGGGAGGRGGRGGGGSGQGGRPIDPGGQSGPRPIGGAPAGPGAPPPGFDEFMRWLQGQGGGQSGGGPSQFGNQLRTGFGAGVNFNELFRGSPGWVEDDVLNIRNSGGMPLPTLPAPRPGETSAQYMDRVSELGYGPDTFASILGPYGFRPDAGTGELGPWNWGAGPVVSTGEHGGGYQFANQGQGRDPSQEGFGLTRNPGARFDLMRGGLDSDRYRGPGGGLLDLMLGSEHFAR